MVKIEVKEDIEQSDPMEYLVLSTPYFKFRFTEGSRMQLKEQLEALKEKRKNFMRHADITLINLAKFQKPSEKAGWELGELHFEDSVASVRDHLFAKIGFDKKPLQKTLPETEKKK